MQSLFVCGDIINYEHQDGTVCSDELARLIISADYSVCNFEAPIEGYGTPQPKSGAHHFLKSRDNYRAQRTGF